MIKFKRCFIAIFMIGIIFFSSNTAFAAVATGSSTYVTVYGYEYEYFSTVSSEADYVMASVFCGTSKYDMRDLPVGYFGGYAKLYNSAGNLLTYLGWTYNAVEIGGLGFNTPKYYTNSGTYYSRGDVRMYNGNGYNTYTTNQSPYVQMFTSKTTYQVNENNEIYGSELILEQFNIKPDLISAIGDNNIAGYVKAIDLEDDIPATLEEAIEYQKNLQDERQIPLYESDGETIIGIFTIHYNLTEEFKN